MLSFLAFDACSLCAAFACNYDSFYTCHIKSGRASNHDQNLMPTCGALRSPRSALTVNCYGQLFSWIDILKTLQISRVTQFCKRLFMLFA